VKKFNMDKIAIKELLYGGINELAHNKKFYYHSTVGSNYCHWTDEGAQALTEFLNTIAVNIFEAEAAELDKRAKELVINGLKGDKV